jgi:hypothetical protein
MPATFGGVRRVTVRDERLFAALICSAFAKGSEARFSGRVEVEVYAVGICLPATLIALVVTGIYFKERSKKL